jgi:hypothetical protein
MDSKLLMCDGTSIAGSAGAVTLIGSVIDLGAGRNFYDTAQTQNPGEAGNVWLNVKVSTAITGASSTTTIALYHHTTASVASGAALISKAGVTPTLGVAGYTVIRQKLPAGTINRYLGICKDIDTAAVSAGAIDAWLSIDGETPK